MLELVEVERYPLVLARKFVTSAPALAVVPVALRLHALLAA
jgi:hypothetical protein